MKSSQVTCLFGTVALLAASLVSTGAIAQEHGHAESSGEHHAHAGVTPTSYGKIALDGWSIEITTDEPIEPGVDAHLDVIFLEKKDFPKAVRAWIGDETAERTGKVLLQKERADNVHTHVAVPKPLEAGDRIWVEFENAEGKKKRSSVALPAHLTGAEVAGGFNVEITPGTAERGISSEQKIILSAAGKSLGSTDLVSQHGSPIHLIVIDPSLTDFQHLHPKPAEDGGWSFAFTPKSGGEYRAFAQAATSEAAEGEVSSASIKVAGEATSLSKQTGKSATVAGHSFTIEWGSNPVTAGSPVELTVKVAGKDGAAAALEPVMDSLAHIVAIDEGRSEMIHLHPAGEAASSGPLKAEAVFPAAGFWKVFVHTKIAGEEIVAPFGMTVVEAEKDAKKPHSHSAGSAHSH